MVRLVADFAHVDVRRPRPAPRGTAPQVPTVHEAPGSRVTTLEQFSWGAGGSASIEVLAAVAAYSGNPINVPAHYRRVGFWLARALLTVVAGAVAVATEASNPGAALYGGIAARIMVQAVLRQAAQATHRGPAPGQTLPGALPDARLPGAPTPASESPAPPSGEGVAADPESDAPHSPRRRKPKRGGAG